MPCCAGAVSEVETANDRVSFAVAQRAVLGDAVSVVYKR